MANFALILCKKASVGDRKEIGFFKLLWEKLRVAYKKPKVEECIRKIELYEGVTCSLLELPYSLEELADVNVKKITGLISAFFMNYAVTSCLLPRKILDTCKIELPEAMIFKGGFLFKSLLVNIIDEIYEKRGIKIENLDIAIVQGKEEVELLSVIRILSPSVKYINILVKDRECIRAEIDRVFDDCGLSIGVTCDCKSAIKGADLVINLGNLKSFASSIRVNAKPVVINYGGPDHSDVLSNGTFINGITVKLPDKIASRFADEVFDYYSGLELAELIIAHRLFGGGADLTKTDRLKTMEEIGKEFTNEGYLISGFVGRRNIMKIRDIELR